MSWTDALRGVRGVQVAAQAKVNLRLRIVAREASGFHQIETLFLRLDLADTVRVRRTDGATTIDVSGDVDLSGIGPPERNLAWRAAQAYYAASGAHGGFSIEIEKRIPLGGGLGGGSADAGAVLRALEVMADSPLGATRLLELAATLGSDVPFLTSEMAYALAWGRGERMLALAPPEPRQVLLLCPPISVSTASAYGWLAESRASAETPARGGRETVCLDSDSLSRWETIASLAENDFELVVADRYEEIASTLAGLRGTRRFPIAMMSGSGSTVFAVMEHGAHGAQLLNTPKSDRRDTTRHRVSATASRVEPVSAIE